MEMGLLDCKYTLTQKERMISSSFMNSSSHLVRVKVSQEQFSCKGMVTKASYSISGNNAISSVSQQRYITEPSPHRVTGTSVFTRVPRVLDAIDDAYDGVIISPESLPANPSDFSFMLRSSLFHWKIKGKKGVWLKIPLQKSELVPVAVQEGFQYHHAEKTYVMMIYWLPEGPCLLPSNASHQVGVGSFVINAQDQVLVVQEKHCSPELTGLWKLPTGFILESEEIFEGAVREVKEETGVDTEFMEVVAFRHAHNVAFEKSDLFFACMLRPLSTKIVVDDHEIKAAKWMPLVEFVNQPLIQGDSMFKKIVDICIARMGKRYCGLSVHKLVSKFDGKLSSLYFNIVEVQDVNCQAG
ncbi:hypothetical protein Leryth_002730 [Lithospermum erythrorhizon]|nr:hypothetical protein Leryth_002730 [Lithospermum erythrorhizon]